MSSTAGFAADAFPTNPNPSLTPGSTCTDPDELRYPEHIKYCERDVDTSLKRAIIQQYDSELHYRIGQLNRADFKIDHYIPLCMGGSNHQNNLWPQHKSVFEVTDMLEQVSCEKMAQGKLRQADAISIIKRAKNDLVEAPRLLEQVRNM